MIIRWSTSGILRPYLRRWRCVLGKIIMSELGKERVVNLDMTGSGMSNIFGDKSFVFVCLVCFVCFVCFVWKML